jgi:phosphotransferase system HPr (HPr) family protein
MNGQTLQQKLLITSPHGLHMRPAAAFAEMARQYQSSVSVAKEGKSVNGKSPLDMMLLAAEQGSELIVEVVGPDAPGALEALCQLLATLGVIGETQT